MVFSIFRGKPERYDLAHKIANEVSNRTNEIHPRRSRTVACIGEFFVGRSVNCLDAPDGTVIEANHDR